jgi:hypothetical protein
MAVIKSVTGDYLLGFAFLALTAVAAMVVLQSRAARRRAAGSRAPSLRRGSARTGEDGPYAVLTLEDFTLDSLEVV